VRHWAHRGWQLLGGWAGEVAPFLLPWANRIVSLQPCLCDIWHDHVLFTGAAVTGIIDYGGAKFDHVAVDLARLLGSTAEDDPALTAEGMNAYKRLRSLSLEEQQLVRLLDRTGALIGLANWLKWLFYERKTFENYATVAQRMKRLVERIERWEPGSLGA
jgi:Ser/Thr protein kinase RdoA (MazF antagonist)